MADFEDLFDGTLGTNLTDHTPDVGTAWTGGGSTTDNATLTGDGEIAAESNESQHTIFSDDLGSPDHQIWFQFSAPIVAVNSRVACRAGDASNNSYGIGCATDGGSDIQITYRDSGSTNTLSTHSHGLTGPFWVRLKCQGDTVSAWKSQNEPTSPEEDTNWTKIGEWTVSVNNTVATPGLFLFGSSAGSTNSDPWISTYKASSLAGGGTADNAIITSASAAPLASTDTSASTDNATLAAAVASVIASTETTQSTDSAQTTSVAASVLSSVDTSAATDTATLTGASASVLTATAQSIASDAAAILTASAMPLTSSESTGGAANNVADSAVITAVGSATLTATEAAVSTDGATISPASVTIRTSAETASALDNAVIVNAQGTPIASVESVQTDANVTTVTVTPLTSTESTGTAEILLGKPEITPALSGAPKAVPVLLASPEVVAQLKASIQIKSE